MLYTDINYQKFQSKRRFGIELEVGCSVTKPKIKKIIKSISDLDCTVTKYGLTGDDQVWHVKDDASCGPKGNKGPKGVEIASFVGQGLKDLNHMAKITDALKEGGCEVNNNCGFHVHVEAVDLTLSQLGILYSYWLKIESILSLALPSRRIDNIYCKNINKGLNALYYVNSLDSIVSMKDLVKINNPRFILEIFGPSDLSYYENDDRRVNFNTVNFARAEHYGSNHRKTLELRWPEGTLCGQDVKSWVILFLNFVDICKNFSVAKNLKPYARLSDVLTCFGLNHRKIGGPEKALANTFRIFDDNLYQTKVWLLKRIIKYGPDRETDNESSRNLQISDEMIQKTIKSAKSELKRMGVLETK